MKNNMYTGRLQAIVKGSMAFLAIVGLVSISSCKKDTNSVAEGKVVELGTGPQLVDSFRFIPTKRIKTAIGIKDAMGNITTLDAYIEKLKKGSTPLSCGTTEELSVIKLDDLGFTFDNKCFSTISPFSVGMTYELTVPESMEPIRNNPASKASVSLTPYGWQSAPSGQNSRDLSFASMVLVGSGNTGGPYYINTKTWRFTTTYSPANMNDYCLNTYINSTFQVATTCPDFTLLSYTDIPDGAGATEEYFDVSQVQIPDVTINNTQNASNQVAIYWQIPVCQVAGCGGKSIYSWADVFQYQIKKSTTFNWGTYYDRPDANSFIHPGALQSGSTYNFRYRADLNGAWSDWQYRTIVVP